MPWPSVTDYTGAIQQPDLCFDDSELAQGRPTFHPARGTPLVYSGNFATVYSVTSGNRKYAVRCFTRAVNDQQARYGHLSDYLRNVLPPSLGEFEFRERGIRVRGDWYPIVKMEWVNGEPLNKHVSENLSAPSELSRVARRWRGAVGDLLSREIAHNDLQHGNVMVQADSTIRLVDYDGIFLLQYQGETSPEIGHQNFQHPQRTGDDYAEYVDNFPALVIYLSLLALADDPGLWQHFNNGDNLIFKKSDYADPANSQCFRALKNSPDATVRNLAAYLEELCSRPVGEVPDLERVLGSVPAASVPEPTPPSAPAQPQRAASEYRRLIQMGQATPAAPTFTPAPPPQPAALGAIPCSQCSRANLSDLIYCDNEECAAELHPGSRFCAYCGLTNPVNAKYCPECGREAA